LALFDASEKEEFQRYKFLAAIHGAKIDGGEASNFDGKADDDDVIFKHPDEYAKMTPEERKAETAKLIKKFKPWAQTAMPTRGT